MYIRRFLLHFIQLLQSREGEMHVCGLRRIFCFSRGCSLPKSYVEPKCEGDNLRLLWKFLSLMQGIISRTDRLLKCVVHANVAVVVERDISKFECIRSACHVCLSFIRLRLNCFSWRRETQHKFWSMSEQNIKAYVGWFMYIQRSNWYRIKENWM
jgi:hypothetical protein